MLLDTFHAMAAGPVAPWPIVTRPSQTMAESLTQTERKITYSVQSLSSSLDSFFSREDLEIEDTGSRLKVGLAAHFEEYEDPSYNFLLGFRLILPNTQEKLHLLVLSDEEDLFERKEGESLTPDPTVSDSVKNQKIGIGVRGLFHKSKRSSIVFDSGIKLRDPIDPFGRLSGRRSFFFSEYELRFIERLYWFESTRWGSSVSLDLDRSIAKKWLARLSNNAVVDHKSGLWKLDHFLALYHLVSERTALGYRAGVTGDDETQLRLQSYYASFNYRFALIKPWLYFEATPKLTWPREEGWAAIPSFYVKIESIFGL